MKYDSGHITEIAGYRLTERIGSGGMGDVYKAFNVALNRTAAIKILHQKDMADRFRNEAYIQSSVSHPNIACLYEYLVTGETACIIMEYVEGDTLDVYLHKRGKLSNGETENIVKQIAAALAYLHDKDILHRDIKPQNFKIQPGGTVTMLDFGIAKNKYTPKLTQQGYMVGTTEYMAPEQFRQQVQKKSDNWSLGVLTYELLTGYMPFDANNAVAMRARIESGEYTKPRILVPQVSDKLNIIIEKSLQVNPANRISARGIENLFGDKKPAHSTLRTVTEGKKPVEELFRQLKFSNKTKIFAAAIFVLILAVVFFPKGGSIGPGEHVPADLQKLTIDVPNASNARIVFPDGKTEKLPYDLTGREGDNFKFTLQAEGFVSKEIEVPITIGRRSYEYRLDKIKP